MDYSPEAIRQAQNRTAAKRERLSFSIGDMNRLDFPAASFDSLIANDTLYFSDLDDTIGRLKTMVQPGGQMLVYYSEILWNEADDRGRLLPEGTPLGRALGRHNLAFQTWDFTQAELERSRLAQEAALNLRAQYEAEGNGFIYENRIQEAEGNQRFIAAGRMSRYLYHVRR
jgi:hypothetical protein